MLLAGDIGGTKTILALFSPEAGPRTALAEEVFASADYPGLGVLVQEFLSRVDADVQRAVFGVAGPVVAGRAQITNLPWVLDERELQRETGVPSVRLLNDLEAAACAVPFLQPADLHTLNVGRAVAGGTIALIAPGTGLGQAFLTWDGSRYHAHPSEGGHVDFAPTTPLQAALLRHLQKRFAHVSYERICSGPGLPNIYAYLKEIGYTEEPAWLAERLAAADDPTPVIANAALSEEPCELCTATLDTFVSILGAEAGNLALKVVATGGVYLGGGIPPRILPALERNRFMEAFLHKGLMSDLLAQVPVHVILNPRVGLLGVARCGIQS
jgi:glucokinase